MGGSGDWRKPADPLEEEENQGDREPRPTGHSGPKVAQLAAENTVALVSPRSAPVTVEEHLHKHLTTGRLVLLTL
jgi:hypothetical protein